MVVSPKSDDFSEGTTDLTSEGIGLSNDDDIVGEYRDRAGFFHAFLLENGRFSTVDPPFAAALLCVATVYAGEPLSHFGAKKPVDELRLMTEWKLAIEATRACDEANIARKFARKADARQDYWTSDERDAAAQDATEYLSRIALVARDKLRHEPSWLMQMKTAARGEGEQERCHAALHTIPPGKR